MPLSLRAVVKVVQFASWSREPLPACLPPARRSNRDVHPNDWGMMIAQFSEFIRACQLSKHWQRTEKEKECVNLYNVVAGLVKPWTRGTGCGIALRMNPEDPLRSELMVSHSWGEDVLECLEALLDYSSRMKLPGTTPIWFCAFSQYQAGDEPGDVGPTVAEQLELDPFGSVVQCTGVAHGMVVVHTSTARVYERLWCVYEISEALRIGAPVGIAYSCAYLAERSGKLLDLLRATTAAASCSNPKDEDRIRMKVEEAGGFKQLDWKIFQFRFESLKEMMANTDCRWEEKLRDEFQQAEKVFLKGTFLSSNKPSGRLMRKSIREIAKCRIPTTIGGLLAIAGIIALAILLLTEYMAERSGMEPGLSSPTTGEPLYSAVKAGTMTRSSVDDKMSAEWHLWFGSLLLALAFVAALALFLVCFCDQQLITLCNDCKCEDSQAPDEISERLEQCRQSVWGSSERSISSGRTQTQRAPSGLSDPYVEASASFPQQQGDDADLENGFAKGIND